MEWAFPICEWLILSSWPSWQIDRLQSILTLVETAVVFIEPLNIPAQVKLVSELFVSDEPITATVVKREFERIAMA